MTEIEGQLLTSPGAIDAIVALADGAAQSEQLAPGGYYIAASRDGQLHHIDLTGDKWRDAPKRKTGTVVVRDVESFDSYIGKHGDDDSEIYADRAKLNLTAVLDAHEQGGPRWGQHRLVLQLRHSDAFDAWMRLSGQLLAQTAFAEFLEDHRSAIMNPPAAELLELAQNFQATTKVSFKSGSLLKSGERQLQYVEETEASAGKRGDITIPDHFELALAVFDGATEAEPVTARLRYRIEDGRLRIGYILDQIGDVVAAAFESVVHAVATRVTVPILRGTPA
jgi:uncharacterized protein YfdQ (DUF2303 family)